MNSAFPFFFSSKENHLLLPLAFIIMAQNPPTYHVPPEFFTSVGPGNTTGSWIFKCTRCTKGITISASIKSRYNIRQHVKAKHTQALQKFDNLCTAKDKRKAPASASSSSSEPVDKSELQSQISQPTIQQSLLGERKNQS